MSDQEQINARIDAIDEELTTIDHRDASPELFARIQALRQERTELLQALGGQDPYSQEFGRETDYLDSD